MAKELWNGQIVDRDAVRIDPEDRGYQFGDGLYEAVRVYASRLFMFSEHFARLQRCAAQIRLTLPFTQDELKAQLMALIAAENLTEGGVYLQVSRGIDHPRNHRIPSSTDVTPVVTGSVMRMPRPVALQAQGLTATVVPDRRWLHCDIKSLSLLGNALALDAAQQKGFDEALLQRDGYFTEASASNLWFVFGDTFVTHPDGPLVLPGITKLQLLRLLRANGKTVREEAVPVSRLPEADEIFISNSIQEIIPITSVDGRWVGSGRPGQQTRWAQDTYIAATAQTE